MIKKKISIIKTKFLKKLPFLLVIVFFLSLTNSYSATVTGVTQSVGVNFGTFAQGTSTGTIQSNGGTSTGGTKYLGSGATNATFSVSGTNGTSGSVTFRTRFIVFVPSGNVTLVNGANQMNMVLSLSSSNTTIKSQTFDFPSGTGTKNLSVTVYGTLTAASNQAEGSYSTSPSYNFIACNCTGGSCPTATSDSRCQ